MVLMMGRGRGGLSTRFVNVSELLGGMMRDFFFFGRRLKRERRE